MKMDSSGGPALPSSTLIYSGNKNPSGDDLQPPPPKAVGKDAEEEEEEETSQMWMIRRLKELLLQEKEPQAAAAAEKMMETPKRGGIDEPLIAEFILHQVFLLRKTYGKNWRNFFF